MRLTFKLINAPFASTWSWTPNLLQDETEIKPGGTVALDAEAVINISVAQRDTIRAIECDIYSHQINYDTMRVAHTYKVIWNYPWLETGTYIIDWEAGTVVKYTPTVPDPAPVVTDPAPTEPGDTLDETTEVVSTLTSNTWIWVGLICLAAVVAIIAAGSKE